MTNILVLNSSAAGEASVSRALTARVLERLTAAEPDAKIISRDLDTDPLPHLTARNVGGLRAGADTPEARQAAETSEQLIGELLAADVLVIGSPMYNFGLTTTLKAWFDHVLRAGLTFRYTAAGPEGLVTGKRAIVVEARGGLYSEGPMAAFDSQEPHLRVLLGFMGVTDVTFIRAEALSVSPEARAAGVAKAEAAVDALELSRAPALQAA